MRVLAVATWSFGRDKILHRTFREVFELADVQLCDFDTDVDLNRTITAFAGEPDEVLDVLNSLCMEAFDTIDLSRHIPGTSRIGALDSCHLILLDEASEAGIAHVEALMEDHAIDWADAFNLPVYFDEKSEAARPEGELAELRDGGFGRLLTRKLCPDHGPQQAHPRLGVAIIGVCEFFLEFRLKIDQTSGDIARKLASSVRYLRAEGDERFLGVSAEAHTLPSVEKSEVVVRMDLPDITTPDPIIEWAMDRLTEQEVSLDAVELVGAIRVSDLPGATRVPVEPAQVIEP